MIGAVRGCSPIVASPIFEGTEMAEKNSGQASGGSAVSQADRMAKSKATRAITASKVAKLSDQNRYAYGKLSALRSALDKMQDRILDGGTATGELVQSCAELEANIGVAMFT